MTEIEKSFEETYDALKIAVAMLNVYAAQLDEWDGGERTQYANADAFMCGLMVGYTARKVDGLAQGGDDETD